MTKQVNDFATFVKEFDDNNADQRFEEVIVAEKQKECNAITGRRQGS